MRGVMYKWGALNNFWEKSRKLQECQSWVSCYNTNANIISIYDQQIAQISVLRIRSLLVLEGKLPANQLLS